MVSVILSEFGGEEAELAEGEAVLPLPQVGGGERLRDVGRLVALGRGRGGGRRRHVAALGATVFVTDLQANVLA